MNEDDIHDQLTQAYLSYFKANEKFEARNSVRRHAETRRWLRKIRELAKLRMEEIHIYQKDNKKTRKGNNDE
jgi:hypothetical protein